VASALLIGFQACKIGNRLTHQQHPSECVRLLGSPLLPEEPSVYNAISWHSERLPLLDSGSFWQSETPEVCCLACNAALSRLATGAWFRLEDACTILRINLSKRSDLPMSTSQWARRKMRVSIPFTLVAGASRPPREHAM